MSENNKEVIEAISELKKEVAVLTEKYDNLSGYIFKELKVDIRQLCDKVENCMNNSVDERHRDLKWMVALMITVCISFVGWALVLVKAF